MRRELLLKVQRPFRTPAPTAKALIYTSEKLSCWVWMMAPLGLQPSSPSLLMTSSNLYWTYLTVFQRGKWSVLAWYPCKLQMARRTGQAMAELVGHAVGSTEQRCSCNICVNFENVCFLTQSISWQCLKARTVIYTLVQYFSNVKKYWASLLPSKRFIDAQMLKTELLWAFNTVTISIKPVP